MGEELFGVGPVDAVVVVFCRGDETADSRLLGSFQGFREGRGLAAGDAPFDEPFDGPQVVDFAGNDEGRRFAALAGPACTADAVDVAFRVLG